MPPDAARPTHRPVGPVAPGCRCVQGACGTTNKEKRVVVSYRSTPERTAVGQCFLITCAVGACRQRKMPAPGTHGRVFAGCGHSVRGHSLPSGCYVRARVRAHTHARSYCYLSCSGSISCSLRNSQLLLVLSASVI